MQSYLCGILRLLWIKTRACFQQLGLLVRYLCSRSCFVSTMQENDRKFYRNALAGSTLLHGSEGTGFAAACRQQGPAVCVERCSPPWAVSAWIPPTQCTSPPQFQADVLCFTASAQLLGCLAVCCCKVCCSSCQYWLHFSDRWHFPGVCIAYTQLLLKLSPWAKGHVLGGETGSGIRGLWCHPGDWLRTYPVLLQRAQQELSNRK